MPVEVTCGNCGTVIYTMRIIKPIRDVVRTNNKCPSCGRVLSASNFTVSADRL